MSFRPIAVVGRACVLPGALTPEALWATVLAGADATGAAPAGRWRLDPARVLAPDAPERAYHDRGGYVTGFEGVFDPTGFRIPADAVRGFDPLVRWTLHTAREALRGVKGDGRAGLVMGNLSLPSEGLSAYAEGVWLDGLLGGAAAQAAGVPATGPENRFMSGLPALVTAEALGLEAGAFALDAACASSLYAIKLACDMLADGRADVMLAGAVNRADDLFLHMGFTALQALSPTGRSRPFHTGADGLLPAEGAAFVALKRLEDALMDGDAVLGVIRGVGLANDGRGTGLLVPASEGQERAMRAAYAQAGWRPDTVGLVECHATGTAVGDATEVQTLSRVYAGCERVPLGSLKGNLGHPITVAGLAGLLKLLGSFEHGVKPPNPAVDAPTPALRGTPFRLLQAPEPWAAGAPRRAALSAFGFGGNDAHLLVEAWDPDLTAPALPAPPAPPVGAIAVVGLGALVGEGGTTADFAADLLGERAPGKRAGAIAWSPRQLRFPPADLKAALPQQLWLVAAAEQALAGVKPAARERVGVYAGMQCDAEIARYGVRWRLAEWVDRWKAAGYVGEAGAWLQAARDAATPVLTAAGVLGTLPNVVANRLSNQFDFGGPGFAVSSEETSGLTALALACRALRAGELDMALVGAVDMADEPVQAAAARAARGAGGAAPADAALVLTLKRLEDARRDGDAVMAVLPDDVALASAGAIAVLPGGAADGPREAGAPGGGCGLPDLAPRLGHPHAASGLVQVAAAVLAHRHGAYPQAAGGARPELGYGDAPGAIDVHVAAMAGASAAVRVAPAGRLPVPVLDAPPPKLHVFAGGDRLAVQAALVAGKANGTGRARLVIVAADDAELAQKSARARAWLAAGASAPLPPGEGIAFAESPIGGGVAALFGGAAGAYAGMGRGLLLALPELAEGVARAFPGVSAAAGWVYDPAAGAPTPLQKLWGSSLLSQAHADLTRRVLGVPFTAAIGLSSGETNSLYAFGAWQDMGALCREFEEAGVFTEHLGGAASVLKRAWRDHDFAEHRWATWRVSATPEAARAALADEPLAALTMILGPRDVVVGGEPAACERAIAAMDAAAAVPLDYDVAVHAPVAAGYANAWRALHRRPTSPVPGVRFYSHAVGGAYEPTADAVADALLGQALTTVDFPKVVEAAYADGVRVFVEHGPQATLAPLVRQVLGERPHVAVSLDVAGAQPVRQLFNALAPLVAAGVPVDTGALEARWAAIAPRGEVAGGPVVTFEGHKPGLVLTEPPAGAVRPVPAAGAGAPGVAADAAGQVMPAAPWLPPALIDWRAADAPRPAAVAAAIDAPPAAPPLAPAALPVSAAAFAQSPSGLPVSAAASSAGPVPSTPAAAAFAPTSSAAQVPSTPAAAAFAPAPSAASVSSTPAVASPAVASSAPLPSAAPISSAPAAASSAPAMRPPAPLSSAPAPTPATPAAGAPFAVNSLQPQAPATNAPAPMPAAGAATGVPAIDPAGMPAFTPQQVALGGMLAAQKQAQDAYMALMAQQAAVHQQFMAQSAAALQAVLRGGPAAMPGAPVAPSGGPVPPAAAPPSPAAPPASPLTPEGGAPTTAPPRASAPQLSAPAPSSPAGAPPAQPAPGAPPPPPAAPTPDPAKAPGPQLPEAAPKKAAKPAPVGPTFDRGQLEILASGKISRVFGPMFSIQDDFRRQVRMPEPPLLLADRVTGIKGEPGSMTTGTIWTETDVTFDSWYLHQGRMPAGIMVESGQADLLLISWLGADFKNQGDRVYRLLGCQLTFHADPETGYEVLPAPGDTLVYDIHVDGHARQGDIRLFFFHYDCHVGDHPRLTVRQGQAGFFTDAELAGSGGVLWDPAECLPEGGRVDPGPVVTTRRSFDTAAIQAFAQGRMDEAFGEGFELARAHVRSPRMAYDPMRFFDTITDLDPQGGPWGRGYLRAEAHVTPEDWFFQGHFKDDPCMPGTLMYEGTLQTMAFYLSALGFALDKDGWRFEPVPEVPYNLRCRGQVTPASRHLVYELFVEEVHDGPFPTLWADLLVTVDGLKAFHCRRMGVRLVPGFPQEASQEMDTVIDLKPVAVEDGFAYGQHSLWACAWGKPSHAFGPQFAGFDAGKRLPRLPGPPYHFMSRIAHLDGKLGEPRVGSTVTAEYDVPPDAWYFTENGSRSMPAAVLMEVALQPCGWLASYAGTPLRSEGELFFRNLDGTGTQHMEVGPAIGTIVTRSTLKSIANAGGMVIVSFEVRCTTPDGAPVWDMDTVFGFFPGKALQSQVGIVASPEEIATRDLPSDHRVDLTALPARFRNPAIAPGMLRMIDRLTGFWPEGGKAGLGRARAEKDVDPDNWYFKAHFFQDPVQPGSLGIEALIQLLQATMVEKGMAAGLASPRFEPLALGMPLTWKYRGQVVPTARVVTTEVELTEIGSDERGVWAKAEAWLWVDGMRIYGASNLGMRIVGGPSGGGEPVGPGEELLDPDRPADAWLNDHKPTYVIPVMPFMSLLDRLAQAAAEAAPGQHVVGLTDVHVQKWAAAANGPLRLRRRATPRPDGKLDAVVERWFESPNPQLSRFEPVATGVVTVAAAYPAPPAAWDAPPDARPQPDPYANGDMFHGPAFQVLRTLAIGAAGASATLEARNDVPTGLLNQALLDGVTHAIPGADLARWTPDVDADQVGYPSRVLEMTLHGPTPLAGEVRCEVRFVGFLGSPRFPRFDVQLVAGGRVWATLQLAYILFPKGPLGAVPGPVRQAFLAERVAVPRLALSREEAGTTLLTPAEVKGSDWLPGTLARLYRAEGDLEALTRQIAVKEHVGRSLGVHPGDVSLLHDGLAAVAPTSPLTRHDVELVVRPGGEVAVSSAGPSALDLTPVRDFWRQRLAMGPWPGEDLYYGLAARYVASVELADPEAFAVAHGRGALYLANHQTGIESLLFSLIASALGGVPTGTLAKTEHRDSWLGRLIAHQFSYPGVADPGLIHFFDRQDPASLPGILQALSPQLARGEKRLMIHVDGTRGLAADQPAQQVSAALLDLALAADVPVIPVRFANGLPKEPVKDRLEFPAGHGKQTYHVGRPIWPDELRPLGLAERKGHVLAAMHALGPAPGHEAPWPADEAFATEVAGWQARAGVGEVQAAVFKTLEHARHPLPETLALVAAVRKARGKGAPTDLPPGAWFRTLADWLSGVSPVLEREGGPRA